MSHPRLEQTTFLTPTTCFTVACIAFSLVALSTVWINSRSTRQESVLGTATVQQPKTTAKSQPQRTPPVGSSAAGPVDEDIGNGQRLSTPDQQAQIGELVSLCARVSRLLRPHEHTGQLQSVLLQLLEDLSLLAAALCRVQQGLFKAPAIFSSRFGLTSYFSATIGSLQATLFSLEASVCSNVYSAESVTSAARHIRQQTSMLDSLLDKARAAHAPPTPPSEDEVAACLNTVKSGNAYVQPVQAVDLHTSITPIIDDKCWIEPPPEYSPPAGSSPFSFTEKTDRRVDGPAPLPQPPHRECTPIDSDVLYDAVNANSSTAVEDLLARGADPSTRFGDLQRTALHQASHLNNCPCIAVLLKHGAIMSTEDAKGDTALHLAAWAGNVEALAVLLSQGADVDWLSGRDGYSPLWCAISAHQIDAARLLLKHGARVSLRSASGNGLTPLHQAAVTGQSAMLELLLDRGAQPDCIDDDRNTPLHYAAASGSGSPVRILLRRGADLEAVQVHGLTAVHWASHKGHVEALTALLEHGARLDRRAKEGATPLHLAANRGHVGAVRLLLERGASKRVSNAVWDGVSGTPAAMAKAKGHNQVAKLLKI